MPTLDEEAPEASSATANASAAVPPTRWPNWAWASLDRAQTREGRGVEELGGDGEHRHVDQAGEAERDDHVEALEAQHAAALAVVAAGHAALGQRGVQVDHVRHHGRADDADGEVERAAAAQAGQEAAQRAVRGGADPQRLIQEAQRR